MVRLSVPRVTIALVGALLLAYAFGIAPRIGVQRRGDAPAGRVATAELSPSPQAHELPTAEQSPAPKPDGGFFPPVGKTFIGVMTEAGPYDFAPVERFAAAAGRSPQVLSFSLGWAATPFDRTAFDRIRNRGMLPMLAWEPWDQRVDEAARKQGIDNREIDKIRSNQSGYRLSRIASGKFDEHLRAWAAGIASLGYPVAIRFAHEMNGDWYPWCERVNGNRPGDYVRAWRHVHDLFEAAGASNVIWVWSPNVRWDDHSTPKLATFYPGDDYVDWVGLSGYYGTGAFAEYVSFDAIFARSIKELRGFTDRPVVVTETGAAESSPRKPEWITQMFQALPRYPDLIGVIWFEVNKERDWRIVSSPAATAAFAEGVAAARYDLDWAPDMVPRAARQR